MASLRLKTRLPRRSFHRLDYQPPLFPVGLHPKRLRFPYRRQRRRKLMRMGMGMGMKIGMGFSPPLPLQIPAVDLRRENTVLDHIAAGFIPQIFSTEIQALLAQTRRIKSLRRRMDVHSLLLNRRRLEGTPAAGIGRRLPNVDFVGTGKWGF